MRTATTSRFRSLGRDRKETLAGDDQEDAGSATAEIKIKRLRRESEESQAFLLDR